MLERSPPRRKREGEGAREDEERDKETGKDTGKEDTDRGEVCLFCFVPLSNGTFEALPPSLPLSRHAGGFTLPAYYSCLAQGLF